MWRVPTKVDILKSQLNSKFAIENGCGAGFSALCVRDPATFECDARQQSCKFSKELCFAKSTIEKWRKNSLLRTVCARLCDLWIWCAPTQVTILKSLLDAKFAIVNCYRAGFWESCLRDSANFECDTRQRRWQFSKVISLPDLLSKIAADVAFENLECDTRQRRWWVSKVSSLQK